MRWACGALGWSPREFWDSTPIELSYAIEGWKQANGVEEVNPQNGAALLSRSDVNELKELMEEHGD